MSKKQPPVAENSLSKVEKDVTLIILGVTD